MCCQVTFEIDVNGILHVTAEDKGTGNKNKITITNDQNRLSPEDIERMLGDAERFADADKKVKEQVRYTFIRDFFRFSETVWNEIIKCCLFRLRPVTSSRATLTL